VLVTVGVAGTEVGGGAVGVAGPGGDVAVGTVWRSVSWVVLARELWS